MRGHEEGNGGSAGSVAGVDGSRGSAGSAAGVDLTGASAEPADGLGALFAPRGIAVIGASRDPAKLGAALARSVAAFPGFVALVNARDPEPASGIYASVTEAAEHGPVDLALVCLPARACADAVAEAAKAGARAAVVYGGGFAEAGPDGERYQRSAAEIESSAALPPDVLRGQLKSTAAELEAALAALDATTWRAEVTSALGRAIPAAEIPWMRVREVWLHAVDLAAGTAFTDLPAELVDTLLDDVTGTLSTRPGCPAVRLAPTDRKTTWHVGPAAAEAPVAAEAPAAELLAWATGRATRPGPVTLPPWL